MIDLQQALDDVDLTGIVDDSERAEFEAHILETLELRVGMSLAERMSDSQLDQFELFIDGNILASVKFLNSVAAGWVDDPGLVRVLEERPAGDHDAVISEFAAMKWLEENFPNYEEVVAQRLEDVLTEIRVETSA